MLSLELGTEYGLNNHALGKDLNETYLGKIIEEKINPRLRVRRSGYKLAFHSIAV